MSFQCMNMIYKPRSNSSPRKKMGNSNSSPPPVKANGPAAAGVPKLNGNNNDNKHNSNHTATTTAGRSNKTDNCNNVNQATTTTAGTKDTATRTPTTSETHCTDKGRSEPFGSSLPPGVQDKRSSSVPGSPTSRFKVKFMLRPSQYDFSKLDPPNIAEFNENEPLPLDKRQRVLIVEAWRSVNPKGSNAAGNFIFKKIFTRCEELKHIFHVSSVPNKHLIESVRFQRQSQVFTNLLEIVVQSLEGSPDDNIGPLLLYYGSKHAHFEAKLLAGHSHHYRDKKHHEPRLGDISHPQRQSVRSQHHHHHHHQHQASSSSSTTPREYKSEWWTEFSRAMIELSGQFKLENHVKEAQKAWEILVAFIIKKMWEGLELERIRLINSEHDPPGTTLSATANEYNTKPVSTTVGIR